MLSRNVRSGHASVGRISSTCLLHGDYRRPLFSLGTDRTAELVAGCSVARHLFRRRRSFSGAVVDREPNHARNDSRNSAVVHVCVATSFPAKESDYTPRAEFFWRACDLLGRRSSMGSMSLHWCCRCSPIGLRRDLLRVEGKMDSARRLCLRVARRVWCAYPLILDSISIASRL